MNRTRSIAAVLILVLAVTGANVAAAEDSAGATAAAVVGDIFYVPGKAIVCGLSGLGYVIAMALTFGALYQESTDFVKGGCGGQWVLTGEDIKPTPKSY